MNLIQNLFTQAMQGKSATASAERRVNVYFEKNQSQKGSYVVYGTPGLTLFSNVSPSTCRGIKPANSNLYGIFGSKVYQITPAMISTNIGTMGTSQGYCKAADNGNQLLIVDGTTTGYIYTYATGIFSTVTLPAAASDITFLTGFFIINAANTGRFYISNAYDATTWQALQFATAESNPDNINGVYSLSSILVLFGTQSTEFWSNVGSSPFPFAPMTGSAINYGLASQFGFAEVDGSIIFLATNTQGTFSIRRLFPGGQNKKVSTHDIDNKINSLSVIYNAVAFSWSIDGHVMFQITWPTDGLTLVYDIVSDEWSEMQTSGGRHLADIGAVFNQKNIVSDYTTGNLYYFDSSNYTDNGASITRLLQTRHLTNQFNLVTLDEIYLDMNVGDALQSGQGSNPQIMLQISKDNGRTWGNERWVSIGTVGNYINRVIWRRFGQARDFVLRFKLTDPVKFVITAGAAVMRQGRQ